MGKRKQKFNWKARQPGDTTIDNTSTGNIVVESNENDNNQYDEANAFALPSEKRKTKVNRPVVRKQNILSKNQKKKLEAVLNRREKKANRAALLQELDKVQAPAELISQLIPISQVQTKGLKRFLSDERNENPDLQNSTEDYNTKRKCISSIKGSKPQIHLKSKQKISDPNILGFESSSDESDSEEDNDLQIKSIDNDEVIDLKNDEHNPEIKTDITEMLQPVESDVNDVRNPEEITLESDDDDVEEGQGPCLKLPDAIIKPSVFIPVNRTARIQKSRSELPIIGEEQVIVEAVNENQFVIITGETGSGKTTQVPQFLYEAGYATNGKMIGVTEPRRVAAISMSQRVAEELNLSSDEVSYLIRYEGNAGDKTKIKFMTDGVLLKEIQKDFLLKKYSAIILDEVHERSIYTDILIGLLSRIVPLRCKRNMPMRLIIMSATLQIDDYKNNTTLFKTLPPIISIESRQYPVTVHFRKITPPDYIRAAFRTACQIHMTLPDKGGILIFVTGQQEVNLLVKKLRAAFSKMYSAGSKRTGQRNNRKQKPDDNNATEETIRRKLIECKHKKASSAFSYCLAKYGASEVQPIDDTDYDLLEVDDEEENDYEDSNDEKDFEYVKLLKSGSNLRHKQNSDLLDADDEDKNDDSDNENEQNMWVLPLYSLLSSSEQTKVFKPCPENYRLCVVATNIAETSLTIPNIKYVIDTGRTKSKLYDKYTGISTYEIMWTSKASANQRAGRAGRTMPGHCYRLYSSAVFNDQFEEFNMPEIKRKPIDDLVLQMKCFGIDYIKNFPFPSSPGPDQLEGAEHRLEMLGALLSDHSNKDVKFTKLTKLGESMSEFPVAPRFAKMLCFSHQYNLMAHTVLVVASLAVPEVAKPGTAAVWKYKANFGNHYLLGDVGLLYICVSLIERHIMKKESNDVEKMCEKLKIRHKAALEVSKLRIQLTKSINANVQGIHVPLVPYMPMLSDNEAYCLRQIVLMGMSDNVARRLDDQEMKEAGLRPSKTAYKSMNIDDVAFIHNSSLLKEKKPEWIVFQEAFQLEDQLYLRGITAIDPTWLPVLVPHLCYIPDSFKEDDVSYDEKTQKVIRTANCTFGRAGWKIPTCKLPCNFSEEICGYFAMFFLEGKVCNQLKKYADHLLSSPNVVLKSWSKLFLPRSKGILDTLISKRICNGSTLFAHWKTDPTFLLDAYLEWIPKSIREEIREIWPTLHCESECL